MFLFEESDDDEPLGIQEMLDDLEHVAAPTRHDNEEIANYTYAAVAISVDEHVTMYVFSSTSFMKQ